MSCTLFIFWISLTTLLSTVVPVTDSCSSAFGFRRREERPIESTTTSEMETIASTTETITIITMTEEPSTKQLSLKEKYTHITDCDERFQGAYCLNGGTCYIIHFNPEMNDMHCQCSSYFIGKHCEDKALEGSYGGGRVMSKTKRSIRRSNETEPRAVSQIYSKPRKNRRRGRPAHKKDRRYRTTTSA